MFNFPLEIEQKNSVKKQNSFVIFLAQLAVSIEETTVCDTDWNDVERDKTEMINQGR